MEMETAMATEMNGRYQHSIKNMKWKHSQYHIYFYQQSFYSPYLSALYSWKLAWWHGVEPLLECEHILPRALESDIWSRKQWLGLCEHIIPPALESDLWSWNQWLGICHMCPAGTALSWTGARISSRSDSTLFEEYPLPYWEAVLRWALEFKSSNRIILVTSWPLMYQWCCIRRIDGIQLGNGGLIIHPRLFPPKLLILLGKYPLLWFGGKGVSLPISYPVQIWK